MNFCVPYQSKVLAPNVLAMKVKKSGRESRVDRTIVRQSGEASQMKDILLLLLLLRKRERNHLIRNLVTSSRVCVGAHKNREQKKNREHGGTSAARRSFCMCTQI